MKDITLKLTPGHGPGQTSVAYAPTAKDIYLATAGADGNVFLRDSLILEPEHAAKVDTPPATVIAVDPKGKYVAVGDEQYVKVRDDAAPAIADEGWV
jgi:chromosome transmission fidelity protein 4